MLDRVSKEDFEPPVGQKVKVYRDEPSNDLEVKEVVATRSHHRRARPNHSAVRGTERSRWRGAVLRNDLQLGSASSCLELY